jgi:cytochrome c-type biogenesis protein CcmH/NrfF
MRWTVAAWFVPVTMMAIGLVAARFALNRKQDATRQAQNAQTSPANTQVSLSRTGAIA